MTIAKHEFTNTIIDILDSHFDNNGFLILKASELLQYLNIKTKAANRGSKSRASFGNHYAIFVLVEDYLNKGFIESGKYSEYSGAIFSDLLRRQRELPFGSKLQNHAFNHRLNNEFRKYFPSSEHLPIIRDVVNNYYWINEHLLLVDTEQDTYNISRAVLDIINAYIKARKSAFSNFMNYCLEISNVQAKSPEKAVSFIRGLIQPNVDARIFEIASFSILKYYYCDQRIFWGWNPDDLNEESLTLYKTGRTNANDGGIDFIMKPLGRIFQVTETIDVGKYFLDIDKVQRYPITFVVKSTNKPDEILDMLKKQAKSRYGIEAIIKKYIAAVEEIINIQRLLEIVDIVLESGHGANVLNEIVLQSRVEFNVETEDSDILALEKAEQSNQSS